MIELNWIILDGQYHYQIMLFVKYLISVSLASINHVSSMNTIFTSEGVANSNEEIVWSFQIKVDICP